MNWSILCSSTVGHLLVGIRRLFDAGNRDEADCLFIIIVVMIVITIMIT